MTNIIDIERALTQYIAEKLNLTVDQDIFRGDVPVNADGCAVAIWGFDVSNTPGPSRLKACFYCHDVDRDKVHKIIADFSRLLPVYGLEVKLSGECTVKIQALLGIASDMGEITADNGRVKTLGSIAFHVII